MTEIKSLLTEDEKVVRDARVHWIVFGAPIVYALIGVATGVFFHYVLGGVILLMTLYPVYTSSIHFFMTHLVLTNKKVMVRIGFLTRDWIQMSFDKIENVYLEEPIFGRYLGYSTVIVSGIGSGTIAVPYVRKGETFIRELEKRLENNGSEQNKPEKVVMVEGDDLVDSIESQLQEKKT